MAVFPTGVAADADLKILKNNLSTTLNGGINNSTTTVVLTDASSFPTAGYVTIDTEAISYTGKSTNTLTGVTRGADNTTAASHSTLAPVFHLYVADHHNAIKDEVKAIENNIATRFGLGSTDVSTTSGNFGIGTANPTAQLHVRGSGASIVKIEKQSTRTFYLGIESKNFGGSFTNQACLKVDNDGTAALPMWITDSGYIQIGDMQGTFPSIAASNQAVRVVGDMLFGDHIYFGSADVNGGDQLGIGARPAGVIASATALLCSENQNSDTNGGAYIVVHPDSPLSLVQPRGAIDLITYDQSAGGGFCGAIRCQTRQSSGVLKETVTVFPSGAVNINGGSLVGAITSGGVLALSSTSHATKGKITFGTSAYDETANALGLGTASPNAVSILDMSSTTKGFLPPRMTTTQRDAITATEGLVVYNASTHKLNVYTTGWEAVTSA